MVRQADEMPNRIIIAVPENKKLMYDQFGNRVLFEIWHLAGNFEVKTSQIENSALRRI